MLADVDTLPRHHQQKLTTSVFWPPSHLCSIKADNPLEADAWIRTIEDKFSILNCTEMDKAAFAAQQLRGPARLYFPLVCVSPGMSS